MYSICRPEQHAARRALRKGWWRQTGWEGGSRIRLKQAESDGNAFDLSQSPLPSYDRLQLQLLHTLLTLHTRRACERVGAHL